MLKRLLVLVLLAALLVACSSSSPATGEASFKVVATASTTNLDTQAVGDYTAVNLTISEMGFVGGEIDESLEDFEETSIDLVDLVGGEVVLADGLLMQGSYEDAELRLIVSEAFVTIEGESGEEPKVQPLKVPSGNQSGFKIKLESFDLVNGGSATVTLNFDPAKSIVATGNGEYILKPVVKATVAEAVVDTAPEEPVE